MDEVHKILCAIGVNKEEKAELVAYQLMDVAQLWHKMCVDGRAPRDIIELKKVYRDFPITILDRLTYANLIELTMLEFDIILGMD